MFPEHIKPKKELHVRSIQYHEGARIEYVADLFHHETKYKLVRTKKTELNIKAPKKKEQ